MSNLYAITYDDLRAVTVSDTVADPHGPFMGLIVTATGTLKVTTRQGATVSFAGTAVGQQISVPIQRVWSTGTSATVLGLKGSPYTGGS